jgi:hypothetical protein
MTSKERALRRAAKSAKFFVIETYLSCQFQRTRDKPTPHAVDTTSGRNSAISRKKQDVGEERLRNGDLRHLEGDVAAVADDLRAGLDQLLLEAGQRPIFDRLGRRQRAQEVAEILSERVKLESDGVGGERTG